MHIKRNAFRSSYIWFAQPATTRFAIKAYAGRAKQVGFLRNIKFSVIAHTKLSLLVYSSCFALYTSSGNTYKFDRIMNLDTKVERAAPSDP